MTCPRIFGQHCTRSQANSRTIDGVSYGDLARLLNLPPSRAERLSPTEHVSARQVVSASGQPWQPDASSDILLIGDSFLEIYSSGEPATSVSAGLAEQLSYHLQRPTDRIASHELWDGATARWALGKTLPEVRNAARGRKIVVWEFAMRYLATADWPTLH